MDNKENIEALPEPTEQNPIVVKDYPYGFRLRTQARYYIETTKKGQRSVFQTLNPKTNAWNKPKKSTYSDILVLYRDKSNGHIENHGLSFGYDGIEVLKDFLSVFETVLTDYQKERIKVFRAIIETRKHVKVSIAPACKTEKEQKEHDEKQKETKKELHKIFIHNLKKEGVKG